MRILDIEKEQSCDEVIHEVRAIKEYLARSFCYDLNKMLDDARTKQKSSGCKVLQPHAKGLRKNK